MKEILVPFIEAYGTSFITLVIVGIVIGLLIEVTIKKLFDSMIEKAVDDVKKEKLVGLKATWSLIIAVVASIVFGLVIVKAMPFPCNSALWVCWIGIVYIVQYGTSLYLIPWLIAFKNREKPEKKAKPNYVKAIRNEDGTLTEA